MTVQAPGLQAVLDEFGFVVIYHIPDTPFPKAGDVIPAGRILLNKASDEKVDVPVVCIGTATQEEWKAQLRFAGIKEDRFFVARFFKVIAE